MCCLIRFTRIVAAAPAACASVDTRIANVLADVVPEGGTVDGAIGMPPAWTVTGEGSSSGGSSTTRIDERISQPHRSGVKP